MDPDATLPLPASEDEAKDVFRFGEQTILKMRDQVLNLDDYGTRIGTEIPDTSPAPGITAATEESHGDPLASIEEKLDQALRTLDALQRRIDSLDATIARIVTR